MTKTKFTPGPWVAKSNGYYFDIGVEPKYPCKDVPVYPTVCIGVSHEQEANARLIAKAPEMYALLLKARETLLQHGDDTMTAEIDLLLTQARGEI